MMGLELSRRARLGLLGVFVFALIALFPLRLALGIMGAERWGVAAREVVGTIWWGGLGQFYAGEVPLGTVDAGLSPFQLLIGRARVDVSRDKGLPDDISGAFSIGWGRRGIDDVTGSLPLGRAAAPLPIGAVAMEDVSVRFSGTSCVAAEGRVRVSVPGELAGLNLSQGLSGEAKCDGEALLLPMVSQSGMEKLEVRLMPDGRWKADMSVTSSDPALGQKLGAVGFAPTGSGYAMAVEGVM